ncbi:MAG TPA: hypothetical protein VFU98_05135, partial [Microlunatus sp.]|nr:hypothetical protein [Microlunatus sp.]
YLLRRTSGTLITAMALHAFWDFSTFAAGGTLFTLVGGPLVGLAALIVVLRQTRHDTPVEPAPAASQRRGAAGVQR